jgi:hypothetical protein
MSTDVLLLALLASMTLVALMVTINTRGRWRATISSMLSACLLGGTVWLFTIQYSAIDRDEAKSEQRRMNLRDLFTPKQGKARRLSALLEETGDFAAELERAQLYIPSYTHEQLVARAGAVEAGLETLQNDISDSKPLLEKYPDAAKLTDEAMAELKNACHLMKAYYYAENAAGEAATERLMKQKARSAGELLLKAVRAVKGNEKR